jgi:AbiU2
VRLAKPGDALIERADVNSRRYRSSAEVKAEFVASLPPRTGELAYELSRSITFLHLKWKLFRALYGTSRERIDLLNRTAPAFFAYLDQIMFHDVVLAITRLTDPPGTGKRKNACLARLIMLLAPHVGAAELAGWRSELSLLNAAVQPLREARNRYLAHDDLPSALNHHPRSMPGASRAQVETMLQRIRGLFESIEEKFCGSHTPHEFVDAQGGEQLIASLERAVGGHSMIGHEKRP